MLTVTYGTVPASFLVTKSIEKLAELEANQFPIGALIALRDFYIDNLLSGADSLQEALIIRDQVAALLLSGGFVLRQWASNNEDLLKDIPGNVMDNAILELDKDGSVKTLGVKWNHAKDAFQYSIKIAIPVSCTKRSMLSSIAQIFDPLGLLAPYLNRFCIPRQVVENHPDAEIQLHGFCDASERAYGACVYIRYLDHNKSPQVYLLCAKSRVAPLKIISIPRLELCGAQLLAQLLDKIKASLYIKIKKVSYWTDSQIVLCWIRATNKKMPVFVAHRVGEIQELTSVEDWNHVGTKENPADLVSRGTSPNELCSSQLWWNGPTWLKNQNQIDEQVELEDIEDSPEEHQHEQTMLAISKPPEDDLLSRFSTFRRLVRVTATCLRFADRCKKRNEVKSLQPLTVEELEHARVCLVKREQLSAFEAEIRALQKNKIIPRNSSLRHLTPFLDNLGLLRVGGRLKHAELQYETKHPLLLPHHSRLTELIILHEHTRHCHAGADATLAAVRQVYWPIRARGTVKKLIRNCIRCFKLRPRGSEQIMGDLPINRVTPSKPFSNTGVDFCGPIYVREGRRRRAKRVKAYVAIFICMAVKAVHLEVVSDMTTDAFLNAFKRFISRRGRPVNVYSDNGTNFVGVNRELEKCKELFSLEQQGHNIVEYSASEGIKWHFIPARAPRFGGLWESAVKSFKNHFYKTTVEAAMTFEEASTLVTQIEAILNSRPLTALSTDPNDLSYLSPGHFLIGSTVTSYPEADITDIKINRLSRWQMIEQIRQHFWRKWSSEYLLNLQRRNKWLSNVGPPIKVGQLVLCREDGLPPLKWSLGRVISVLPGADKIVRTAVIKTSTGEYKRPAVKLCVLPIEDC
ncbi:uncharacterized protein LOC112452346, partial [Temnothorax curvispinosus]|uniref:Uncharacterized protein LOC112452346 n=1 Tax=Temnothorax curvispinosus TaxID=300111 RepID=A0A6J1PFP4_9HYME